MLKIVLIDDDPISTFITEKLISKYLHEPFQIYKFEKAADALKRIYNISPNYLFLDLNMPEMNGWEFLEQFSPRKTSPEIYILSSSLDQRDINRANDYSQVKQYLSKPMINKYISHIFN
ncbi:response regulator [Echinicola jeungdonensis]|uniref:Response regulator n=1 Tax=Echinicola jeungdonensis TaxID=709343 RepID=A0ABV5J071_9BACT|nr:response regulator [Echinicola jeungdonensis]MDN3671171.1 response regulator [Echinicola jeungdonensis]